MNHLEPFRVSAVTTIREAIKQMDVNGEGVLIIEDSEDRVVAILTDGDFRRAVLDGVDFSQSVFKIANQNFRFVEEGASEEELEHIFRTTIVREIPVLNKDRHLVDVILKDKFLLDKTQTLPKKLPLPSATTVVVMAGGQGTRLAPFTAVFPKPLLPVGDKPVILHILERFKVHGVSEFYLSVNYKSHMLRAYFDELCSEWEQLKIFYLTESSPLGTAGALSMLKRKVAGAILVTNCDVLIDADYSKLIDFHNNQQNKLTIVGAMVHQTVPYGVCEIENGGQLTNIREKPSQDHLVSTGMYVLHPTILELIPDHSRYDMPDLISALRKQGERIGVFPITQEAFLDVGQWDEYKKTLRTLGLE